MTLVSGADLTSANPTAFITGNGNLTIGTPGTWVTVYTENAPLRLAAGSNVIVNPGDTAPTPVALSYMINSTMAYNVGTYSGPISVSAGEGINLGNGGIIQSVTGDIDVQAGNDLTLYDANSSAYPGAIRTTGESPGKYSTNYWTYNDGGNITVRVGGNVNGYSTESVTGSLDVDGWDSFNMTTKGTGYAQGWSASYIDNTNNGSKSSVSTRGLATMAGGNLTIYAGGNFTSQAGTFSPYTYQWNTQHTILLSSTAAGDNGNLTIFSGGSMQGRLMIADGIGELRAMGNFGGLAPDSVSHFPIELFAATLNVTAQGDIESGGIVNPTICRPFGYSYIGSNMKWDLEYTPETSVSLTSVGGNVELYGDDGFYGNFAGGGNQSLSILPPTVTITAGGDINLLSNFTLAPYQFGNLSLTAGGNINGLQANGLQALILMSEMPDALPGQPYNQVYGVQQISSSDVLSGGGLTVAYLYQDPVGLLHTNDTTSAVVNAGGASATWRSIYPSRPISRPAVTLTIFSITDTITVQVMSQ